MELNIAIFQWFHQFAHMSSVIDGVIRFCANPLGILLVVLIAWYLLRHHTHVHGLWELCAFFGVAFLSAGAAYIIKEALPTLRPTDYFPSLDPLIAVGGGAFPSMHTAFYAALGGAMIVAHRRSGFLIILLALVIGAARVASGVHWPYDILFGALLGVTMGWTAMKVCYGWMTTLLQVRVIS